MLEIIKSTLNDKSGVLTVILSVIILAVGGSYKLLTDRLNEEHRDVIELQKDARAQSERVTVLETIHRLQDAD